MATIKSRPVEKMAQSMRQIREEISNEIRNMTFAEERAYLDNLLKNNQTGMIDRKEVGSKSPS
jgi:hypothetical protein